MIADDLTFFLTDLEILAMKHPQYYQTVQDDRLDRICHHWYGQVQGQVEAVLQANPRLADYPALLPPGILIAMPQVRQIQQPVPARVWE